MPMIDRLHKLTDHEIKAFKGIIKDFIELSQTGIIDINVTGGIEEYSADTLYGRRMRTGEYFDVYHVRIPRDMYIKFRRNFKVFMGERLDTHSPSCDYTFWVCNILLGKENVGNHIFTKANVSYWGVRQTKEFALFTTDGSDRVQTDELEGDPRLWRENMLKILNALLELRIMMHEGGFLNDDK